MRQILPILITISMIGCTSYPTTSQPQKNSGNNGASVNPKTFHPAPKTIVISPQPEKNSNVDTKTNTDTNNSTISTSTGQKILLTGQKMIADGEIIRGGCWDYIDTLYNRAGYPNTKQKRNVVFKSSKKSGPYAQPEQIQAGDWIYHVNHSYGGIEHSGVFVRWIDKSNLSAEMLSYAGENRGVPARYKTYDLSSTYTITRAKD